jgi:glycosyltransferase involved in cell wall biosynthesis
VRILYWGTYDVGKPRTRLLRDGLRSNGVTVDEIHSDLWRGIEDKSQVRGVTRKLRLLARWFFCYPRLLWLLCRVTRPDVLMVGFPGVLDMLLVAPIARIRGIPLAWDMFMSIYDTVVEDRKLLRPHRPPARVLHALEGFALRRADLVFLDTRAHAERVENLFRIERGTIGAVWVGAEATHFHPREKSALPGEQLIVLFYGQFIPLHGIETIIRAARLMRDEPVHWQLIGRGQEAPLIEVMLREDPLSRLQWDAWVDYAELPKRIADADICLGIFGTSEKAACVIPNKVFQIVAMGRPLITRDSSGMRELLTNTPPCSYLIPPHDAEALADAIRNFAMHRVPDMSRCHASLEGKIDSHAIGRQCIALLNRTFDLEG